MANNQITDTHRQTFRNIQNLPNEIHASHHRVRPKPWYTNPASEPLDHIAHHLDHLLSRHNPGSPIQQRGLPTAYYYSIGQEGDLAQFRFLLTSGPDTVRLYRKRDGVISHYSVPVLDITPTLERRFVDLVLDGLRPVTSCVSGYLETRPDLTDWPAWQPKPTQDCEAVLRQYATDYLDRLFSGQFKCSKSDQGYAQMRVKYGTRSCIIDLTQTLDEVVQQARQLKSPATEETP